MKGNPSVCPPPRLCHKHWVEKKSRHFIVLGSACLTCLQMCCDLISVPLHKLRQLCEKAVQCQQMSDGLPLVKCLASPWQKINLTGLCAKDSRWSKTGCEWPNLYPGWAKQAGVNKKEVELCKTATLLSPAYKGHFTSYFPWWFGSCRSTGWLSGRQREESNNSSVAERHKKKGNEGASGNHLHRNHCLTETTETNDWRLKWNLNHLKETKGRGKKHNTETQPQTWRTLPDVWRHVSASVCVWKMGCYLEDSRTPSGLC